MKNTTVPTGDQARSSDGIDAEGKEAERVGAAPDGRPRASLVATMAAVLAAAFAVALAAEWCGVGAPAADAARRWTFVDEVKSPETLGFRTHDARGGAWVLDEHAAATGARALVNLAGAPGEPPAIAVLDRPSARDLEVDTRCMVSPDLPEQACGVVFRYVDAKNYYLSRVDAVAGDVSLSVVVGGREQPLVRARATVRPSVWQDLRVRAVADRFIVEWNGRRVIDVPDVSLGAAGGVGLWARASCVAYFDELEVRPLAARLHPDDLLPSLL
ncbi:hypothetical protein [Sorangium sp. So ce1153]|uniref:hypothetical protein n=1 Tax=Sorangium sp. So ce1153 TaxID=3133333 RepID=UPI003F646B82